MCAYQRVRNVSFLENFAYVLNESSLVKETKVKLMLSHFAVPQKFFTAFFYSAIRVVFRTLSEI